MGQRVHLSTHPNLLEASLINRTRRRCIICQSARTAVKRTDDVGSCTGCELLKSPRNNQYSHLAFQSCSVLINVFNGKQTMLLLLLLLLLLLGCSKVTICVFVK